MSDTIAASTRLFAVVDPHACLHAAPAMFPRNCTTAAPLNIG